MKINVTVDLDDFYNNSDDSFNEQILSHLESQVKNQIWLEFKKVAFDKFKEKVDSDLNNAKNEELNRIVSKIISENRIKVKSTSQSFETISLFEYIEETLNKSYFGPSNNAESLLRDKMNDFKIKFDKTVAESALSISKELTDRYDLMFASHIVNNLGKAGMLKDNVSELLLNSNNETK